MPRLDRRRLDRRRLAHVLGVALPALLTATIVVAVLEQWVGVGNASSVYLAAIVATAVFAGTWAAIATAVAAFLLYDYLFIQPLYTFTVQNPDEWLGLVLLLFVGIVVGRLAALQRARAEDARMREREARALFEVSRALATRTSTAEVLPAIAGILLREAAMARIWIALGSDDARERVAADTGAGVIPAPVIYQALRRMPGSAPAVWTRVHVPGPSRTRRQSGPERFRVRIDTAGGPLGSVWALRERDQGEPHASETRLFSAAADQIGQALAHDRFAADAQAAEIARQSDALKSALLQSVSHDLRTPLATIRAAAGTLRPGSGLSENDQRESADAIDREVEYLNRLVTNLLDLSRIEGGALRADTDAFELDDLVGQTLDRLRARLAGRPVDVALEAPPVEVDAVFLDEAVTNVLDNAIKYAPPSARIRLSAQDLPGEPFVRLVIEDAGPGVPQDALSKIFEKFYRVPGTGGSSRSGTGVGLAVVRGLVEAMGGRVSARRSTLGGLAVEIDLPSAHVPLEVATAGPR